MPLDYVLLLTSRSTRKQKYAPPLPTLTMIVAENHMPVQCAWVTTACGNCAVIALDDKPPRGEL